MQKITLDDVLEIKEDIVFLEHKLKKHGSRFKVEKAGIEYFLSTGFDAFGGTNLLINIAIKLDKIILKNLKRYHITRREISCLHKIIRKNRPYKGQSVSVARFQDEIEMYQDLVIRHNLNHFCRKIGKDVVIKLYNLNQLFNGFPDLFVSKEGDWFLCEMKYEDDLLPSQKLFILFAERIFRLCDIKVVRIVDKKTESFEPRIHRDSIKELLREFCKSKDMYHPFIKYINKWVAKNKIIIDKGFINRINQDPVKKWENILMSLKTAK